MKYLIYFNQQSLKNSYAYITRLSLIRRLISRGDEYTFDNSETDYQEAIFDSSETAALMFTHIHGVPFSVIGAMDSSDFIYKNETILLSQNAHNIYPSAKSIIIISPWQEEFLKSQGIKDNLRLEKPNLTFDPKQEITETERKAFRSFYQVPEERNIVISYGSYTNSEEAKIMESIARLNPDTQFFFFGFTDRIFIQDKAQKRMSLLSNMHFLNTMPLELYRSSLHCATCILFTTKYLTNPLMILDYQANGVPIISYKNENYQELVNPSTAIIPKDFPSLFKSINTIKENNQAEGAKKILNNLILNLA
ncbi:MAG: hypothetical protein WCR67_00890 [Bacilli bacterium]